MLQLSVSPTTVHNNSLGVLVQWASWHSAEQSPSVCAECWFVWGLLENYTVLAVKVECASVIRITQIPPELCNIVILMMLLAAFIQVIFFKFWCLILCLICFRFSHVTWLLVLCVYCICTLEIKKKLHTPSGQQTQFPRVHCSLLTRSSSG